MTRAIILAAGRGSRMRDKTEQQPKALTVLNGVSLLDRQIDALKLAGIEEIGIVTGYRREAFSGRGLHEFHNSMWARTNMLTSLCCAEEWLLSGPCIVSYSDIFYEANAVELLLRATGGLAMTYDPNWLSLWARRFEDPLSDAETFRVDGEGMLIEIGGKPKAVDEIGGQYMGLFMTTPKGWMEIQRIRASVSEADRDAMHMTHVFQRVIEARGVSIQAIKYEGVWGEVDTPEDVHVYEGVK